MIQSFFVYGLLGLFLWLLGLVSSVRGQYALDRGIKLSFWTWDIILAIFIFSTVSGIRWQVGVDHLNYLQSYLDLEKGLELSRDKLEDGFLFITKFFVFFEIHYSVYFAFLAAIQIFFVYYTFKDERNILPFLGLIIVFGGQYLIWMNGIRQAIAACMFVYSIQFLVERKFVKYFTVIFIATLFHQSAIVLLIFYFVPFFNYFKSRIFAVGLLIFSVIVGFYPHWIYADANLVKFLSFVGYDSYGNRLDYFINEYSLVMSFGPRRILSNLICLVVILFFNDFNDYSTDKRMVYFYNFSIIGTIYFNIFANAGHLFLRPTYYFTIFTPIVISFLLSYYSKFRNYNHYFKFFTLFIPALLYLVFSIVADSNDQSIDYTNFKFFWDFN